MARTTGRGRGGPSQGLVICLSCSSRAPGAHINQVTAQSLAASSGLRTPFASSCWDRE